MIEGRPADESTKSGCADGGLMSDTSNSTRPESRWSRFLGFLRWLDQAMEATETDILDRRLRRLEREVAQLKAGQAGPQQASSNLAGSNAVR
jgi:hypothetical protein